MTAEIIRKQLRKAADKDKAKILQRFFKTDPGEYGEGDIFLGISVPVLRKLSKEHDGMPLNETIQLLNSPDHAAVCDRAVPGSKEKKISEWRNMMSGNIV